MLEDLLVVRAAEGHALRAPLRHADAVAEPASVEDHARRQLVDGTGDPDRCELAVLIEEPLIGRADELGAEDAHVHQTRGVAPRDPFRLAAPRELDGEQAALEPEVVAGQVLSDVARSRGADDARQRHAARAGDADEVDALRHADAHAPRTQVVAELRRGELAVPLPARLAPTAVLRKLVAR